MTHKVQKLWQTLEQQRLDIFQELATIDPSVSNRKPAPETWSAFQNLEHLIAAESASLAYLQKKMSSGGKGIPKAGVRSWVRWALLRLAFAMPTLKFKAPARLPQLPETSEFDDLNKRFAAHRLEFKAFLDTLSDDLLESELWKHPRAGKMSIAQMLDFFVDHVNRHRKQLRRAIQ